MGIEGNYCCVKVGQPFESHGVPNNCVYTAIYVIFQAIPKWLSMRTQQDFCIITTNPTLGAGTFQEIAETLILHSKLIHHPFLLA